MSSGDFSPTRPAVLQAERFDGAREWSARKWPLITCALCVACSIVVLLCELRVSQAFWVRGILVDATADINGITQLWVFQMSPGDLGLSWIKDL